MTGSELHRSELHHRCSTADGSIDEGDVEGRLGCLAGAAGALQKPAAAATTPLAPSPPLLRAPGRSLTPHRGRGGRRGGGGGGGFIGGGELCGVPLPRLPRTSILVRVLAAAIALLVALQAVSCGLFFCVALPFGHARGASYVDVRDIVSDALPAAGALALAAPGLLGGAAAAAAAAAAGAALPGGAAAVISTPKLIPRVVHQTYRSKRFPRAARPLVRSWRGVNGDAWEVRFYDDVAAHTFVRREFPEYLEAYLSLPKDVERADFFKYMVVLRMGGAYADIDTECRRPLDEVITPTDTLVVGWDAEAPDAAAAARRGMARRRQLLPWFFAAAPGHPALRELADRVARGAHGVYSNSSVRDTQERTGQGLFTDVVLRHAVDGGAAKASDPWRVRVLPRAAFGARPDGLDGLEPGPRDAVVVHHFLGSWQSRAPGWGWGLGRSAPPHRIAMQVPPDAAAPQASHPGAGGGLFPVSAAFEPPFTVFVHLAGAGDAGGGGADVGAEITRYGGYQPALAPGRGPSVADALIGSLGPGAAREGQRLAPGGGGGAAAATDAASRGVFVDVGAGEGFFSLAAAARGHRAVALEASPRSLEALRAGIAYNGFGGLVEVVSNVTLGAKTGTVCLPADAAEAAEAAGGGGGGGGGDTAAAGEGTAGGGPEQAPDHPQRLRAERRLRETAARLRRGYADPGAAAAGAAGNATAGGCAPGERALRRATLSELLGSRTDVATLRIAAHGHEGWVLEGLLPYLRAVHRPAVIYLEFCPAALRAAGYSDPAAAIRALRALGYSDVAHAGRVCDARWANATRALRAGGSFSPAAQLALHQPTWCKLRAVNDAFLLESADGELPENLLFVLRRGNSSSASGGGGGSSGGGSSGAGSSSSGSSGGADDGGGSDASSSGGGGSDASSGGGVGGSGASSGGGSSGGDSSSSGTSSSSSRGAGGGVGGGGRGGGGRGRRLL